MESVKGSRQDSGENKDVTAEDVEHLKGESESMTTPEFIERIEKAFREGGMAAVKKLHEHLDDWKSLEVNICVIGNAGTGKSTLINALMGLKPKDPGAAKVGAFSETTTGVTRFYNPKHPNLIFWDVPGVGTPQFPKDTFLDKVSLDEYDVFLLLSNERFTENELWFAEEIQQKGRKIIFVKTKIDRILEDEKHDQDEEGFDEHKVLGRIRKDHQERLAKMKESPEIYLVSGRYPERYDFGRLVDVMVSDAPLFKRDAFLFSLTLQTERLLQEKKKSLERRQYLVALGSAMAALVPIPGVSAACDLAILIKEGEFYKEQLGLDEESLKQVKGVKKLLYFTDTMVLTASNLLKSMNTIAISEAAENVLRIAIPVIGSLLSRTVSYGVTLMTLRQLLDGFYNDALLLARETK